jgi:hypothetical protein
MTIAAAQTKAGAIGSEAEKTQSSRQVRKSSRSALKRPTNLVGRQWSLPDDGRVG